MALMQIVAAEISPDLNRKGPTLRDIKRTTRGHYHRKGMVEGSIRGTMEASQRPLVSEVVLMIFRTG